MRCSLPRALDYFDDLTRMLVENPADVGDDGLDSRWKNFRSELLAPYQSSLPESSDYGKVLYHFESVEIYLILRVLVGHLPFPENHEVG